MREFVIAHEVRALRAFARAGAAEDEDYGDFGGGEGGGVFGGGGELGLGGGWGEGGHGGMLGVSFSGFRFLRGEGCGGW